MKQRWKYIISLSLPLQVLLIFILGQYEQGIEHNYSMGLFPYIAESLSFFYSAVPFSLGDIIYIFLIFIIVKWFIGLFFTRKHRLKNKLLDMTTFLASIYLIFNIFWGFNYYRLPIDKKLDIDTGYSTKELKDLSCRLIDAVNKEQRILSTSDTIAVQFPTNNDFDTSVQSSYIAMEEHRLITRLPSPVVKSSIFSTALTYAGFSGYYNPFTNECQINSLVPDFRKPTIMAHEKAHQIGYAKENEANFIACITTINSRDRLLRYSGLCYALQHCLKDLRIRDPLMQRSLIDELNKGVIKNFKKLSVFWSKYDNPFEPVMKVIYGNFLKANNQPKGIDTYNYVVALLVNYYQEKSTL